MTRSFRFKRLEQWKTGGTGSKMELSLPLPRSASGLVLRYCPNEECHPRRFQLGDRPETNVEERSTEQRRVPGTSGCTCPYCGQDDEDDAFLAPEDFDAAMEKIGWAVQEDLGRWLNDVAKGFNSRTNSRNSLIRVEMESSHRPRPEPRPWRQDLLRALECHLCNRAYGVYAIAFFCPDCGASNLSNHFEREVTLVIGQVDLAESIQDEGRELAFRLLGNAHEDVVTAFETYLKSAFNFALERRPDVQESLKAGDMRGNPFQNLERTEKLFRKLGVSPFNELGDSELEQLQQDFEKRHVIGHNLGLADHKYARSADDAKIGETVQLLGTEVEQFARGCLKAVRSVEAELPELHR